MMNIVRMVGFLVFSLALAACGGHGFEGEYRMEIGGDVSQNPMVQALNEKMAEKRLVIGENYTVSDGEKHEYDSIVVESEGDNRYLVFVKGDEREKFKIIDDDTLEINEGFVKIRLVRTK
ncbi:MAG: hypothetical protein D6694_04215 [Gammaproteobacteria bacterium]|nr:MAG: hypothetical protein D6694_04215 [Gammaproteobacteria bacterium]